MENILLLTDSYKISHFSQYPPETETVFSYFESRGGYADELVFFGLRYILKKYLADFVVTREKIEEAAEILGEHLNPGAFNRDGWEYILDKHHGILPVTIKAVPEGTVIAPRQVLMTVENNDPKCFWLTNYLETLLVQVWYPITVATYSREVKKVITKYLLKTGYDAADFKFHDFGFRGASSVETAAIGGAAHLVNFLGTDTLAALPLLKKYYGKAIGHSIPAAEHSTITSWGRLNEKEAFKNMLIQYPKGPVAVVSDSYDIYQACRTWGDELYSLVMNREGTLVIRPDSGDPHEVIPKMLEILGSEFGDEINRKGYRLLPPQVRIIQGDGVSLQTIETILETITQLGWSADNLVFGCGGALLQKCNRDTHKFAFKACAVKIKGVWRDVYKDPITDPGKTSKKGRLDLIYKDGYKTVPLDPNNKSVLETVFENGQVFENYSLDDIRERAAV